MKTRAKRKKNRWEAGDLRVQAVAHVWPTTAFHTPTGTLMESAFLRNFVITLEEVFFQGSYCSGFVFQNQKAFILCCENSAHCNSPAVVEMFEGVMLTE